MNRRNQAITQRKGQDMAAIHRTYIAFPNGSNGHDHAQPDSPLFRQIMMWSKRTEEEFWFTHSNDKLAALPDMKLKEMLRAQMASRLKRSRHLLVVMDKTTALLRPTDWMSMEICYAVDECKIPVIALYAEVSTPILRPDPESDMAQCWPKALRSRIINRIAGVIHIPFHPAPLKTAVDYFSSYAFPNDGGLGWYTESTYDGWGMRSEALGMA